MGLSAKHNYYDITKKSSRIDTAKNEGYISPMIFPVNIQFLFKKIGVLFNRLKSCGKNR